MKDYIPSKVSERPAIVVLQKRYAGGGFAEAEKLRLVTILLLAGTHAWACFNGMFSLCCSTMCSDVRTVTQLPEVKWPTRPERISTSHLEAVTGYLWVTGCPWNVKILQRNAISWYSCQRFFFYPCEQPYFLSNRLTPSMMESKSEVTVSISESLALCKATTVFALGEERNRHSSAAWWKKKVTPSMKSFLQNY